MVDECGSEPHSRSASPAPSSGLESNLIKDAQIQIEVPQDNLMIGKITLQFFVIFFLD